MAITRLEQGHNNSPNAVEQDTITDTRLRATDDILLNPHRPQHVSPAASVMDLRHTDREGPGAHCGPAEGPYAGRGSVPRFYKLNFPMFDVQDDPLSWLNRCDQFSGVSRRWRTRFGWLHSIRPIQPSCGIIVWSATPSHPLGAASLSWLTRASDLCYGPIHWANSLLSVIRAPSMTSPTSFSPFCAALTH